MSGSSEVSGRVAGSSSCIGAFLFSVIRTHICIAHIASNRIESPVDSRQCDLGINIV